MSARRAARGAASAVPDRRQLPDDLAAGPCIELWCDPDNDQWPKWLTARSNWSKAIYEWSKAAGLTRAERNEVWATQVRTSTPWSREAADAGDD